MYHKYILLPPPLVIYSSRCAPTQKMWVNCLIVLHRESSGYLSQSLTVSPAVRNMNTYKYLPKLGVEFFNINLNWGWSFWGSKAVYFQKIYETFFQVYVKIDNCPSHKCCHSTPSYVLSPLRKTGISYSQRCCQK